MLARRKIKYNLTINPPKYWLKKDNINKKRVSQNVQTPNIIGICSYCAPDRPVFEWSQIMLHPELTLRCFVLFAPVEHNILINGELLKVNDWLQANHLSLNVNEIKYMMFHKSQKAISNFSLNLILNHGEIEKVNTFNFLGITLDENIT